MPPANALLTEADLASPEARYPLALCQCRSCELIQLTHIVASEVLFQHYVYFSSVSEAMTRHFAALADDVATRFVPSDGLVVEIGSNDGILLRSLLGRPLRVLGVDPARNVGEQARVRGVPTVTGFFSEHIAREIRQEHGPASAILANNVLAHIDDLSEVMRGVQHLLVDDGVVVIEVPYIVDFLKHLEFDTVYHEHLSYFGVRPLTRLFERFGMEIFEIRKQSVHGGTIRVFARPRRSGTASVDVSVATYGALEQSEGTADLARLARFAQGVQGLRDELTAMVHQVRAAGQRVVGYAASAKGNVLMNYCRFGPAQLEYIIDATPVKQGLYSPGVRIPIKSPEHFRADRPDYALLLAWNHKDEILAKEQAYRAAGGKFIVPIPKVHLAQ